MRKKLLEKRVDDWIEASKVESGFFFRPVSRHGHIGENRLSGAAVALIIKRNSHLEGKEGSYSGHSLRAGFCTTAALKGLPEHAIMKQSRHKK